MRKRHVHYIPRITTILNETYISFDVVVESYLDLDICDCKYAHAATFLNYRKRWLKLNKLYVNTLCIHCELETKLT